MLGGSVLSHIDRHVFLLFVCRVGSGADPSMAVWMIVIVSSPLIAHKRGAVRGVFVRPVLESTKCGIASAALGDHDQTNHANGVG